MSDEVTDLVLKLLDDVEQSAQRGAYNLYDKIQRLKRINDVRILVRAIIWSASDNERLKRLGVEALEYPERLLNAQIDALAGLMRDENPEIRSWATFFVGVQCDDDSDRIREMLFERIADPHIETREEALVGLARRKDARAFDLVSSALKADDVSTLAVEAAEELRDPRLIPLLKSLQSWWDVDNFQVQFAIEACSDG